MTELIEYLILFGALLITVPSIVKSVRVYLLTKRIEKCMSYSSKNWGTIRRLEHELKQLTQK